MFYSKKQKIRMCNIIPFIKTLPEILRRVCDKLLKTRSLNRGKAIATIIMMIGFLLSSPNW